MKILIADDDSITRRLLETILSKWGYQVMIAQDGDEAWRILQGEGAPKLAILDWMMPGIDGIEICRRARQRLDAPYIYIMLLTSKIRKEDIIEGMDAGADDYLTKPFNRHELEVRLGAGLRILDLQEALLASTEELADARIRENRAAHHLREALLLGQPPAGHPGLEVAACSVPGTIMEGDFYDFFPCGPQGLDIVLGDVQGQGLPAALIAAATRTHFLRVLHRAGDITPAQVVTQVADLIGGEFLGNKSFETLCYARFDPAAGALDYVDCGHAPTLHFQKLTQTCHTLRGDNMPLGITQSDQYRAASLAFQSGDHFLFSSEGITSAQNEDGEAYGPDRLSAFVTEHGSTGPTELLDRLIKSVQAFAAAPISAPLTAVAVRVME
ncbi:MAG: PP2C family protein-serine/threonine phosphatase [Janthinobacterium lividum]